MNQPPDNNKADSNDPLPAGEASKQAVPAAELSERLPRNTEEQKKVHDSITELFEEKITFNAHLGMRIRNLTSDEVVIEFQMRPELVGHYLFGRLHGGVITSVLDATGGLAVMQSIADFHQHENAMQILSRFRYLGTVDLRVDFLRQGVGELFYAEAKVVRLGRRIAATSMTLHNNSDSLIATGNATYIVS